MVARDVLLLVVALARVDEAVIEPPPLVEQREDGRAAVPGDVGNLVTVVGVGRVGDVDGLLIGVLELGRHLQLAEREQGVQHGVHALDLHFAQIEHRPAELLSLGIGDDFICDFVVVGVDRNVEHPHERRFLKIARVFQADVELFGIFGLEEGVAHVRIVEVVEGRHTEHPFVEGAYREVVVFQHFERSEERRGSHSLVWPGFEALDLFVDKVTQHAGLHLQPSPFKCRGQCGHMGIARRKGEGAIAFCGHVKSGVERIPLEVIGQRHLPVFEDVVEISAREIELLLLVGVLGLDQLGVLILVMGVVGGVLGVEQRAEFLRPAVGQRSLDERVGVPQPLTMAKDVVDDGSRDAAFGVVGVGPHGPLSVGHLAVESGLHARSVDVAVLSVGRCVVGDLAQRVAAAVAEFVPAGGIDPLAAERRADGVGDLILVAHRGIDEPERAGLHRGLEIGPLALLEAGAPRSDVDGSRGPEILGRLENVTLLSVIERYFLHVVQREAPQIDLPVLGVAQLDSVVEDRHVVGAH